MFQVSTGWSSLEELSGTGSPKRKSPRNVKAPSLASYIAPTKLQNRYAVLPVEEILEHKLDFQEPQETLEKMEPLLTKNLLISTEFIQKYRRH